MSINHQPVLPKSLSDLGVEAVEFERTQLLRGAKGLLEVAREPPCLVDGVANVFEHDPSRGLEDVLEVVEHDEADPMSGGRRPRWAREI